jgi:hypothetical protein
VLIVVLADHQQDRRQSALNDGQEHARVTAAFVNTQLRGIQVVATNIAKELTEGRLDPVSVKDRLQNDLEKNPGFWGVGACYEPAKHLEPLREPGAKGYCPYWTRPGGVATYTAVMYAYWDPDLFLPGAKEPRGIWYQRPRDEGAQWNPPYFGTTSQRMVAEYVVPYFDAEVTEGDERAAGAIFANFTLDQIDRDVDWLDLGGRGYGFLISADGTYVTHPIEEYWDEQRNISEIAAETDNATLVEAFERGVRGENGFVDYRDEITGRDAWLFFEPVEPTGWTLASVVIKAEVVGRDATWHHLLMWIGGAVLVGLFALSVLLLRVFRGVQWISWEIAISLSALCALGIGYVWYLTQTTPQTEAGLGAAGQSLTETVDTYSADLETEPLEVFTGVSIDSVEEGDGGNLVVSGIAWQHYFDATEADLTEPGFVVSEDIGTTEFVPRYDRSNGNERVIGWSFRTTLRGPSDSSRFPFDRGEISMRLSHQEFGRPIVLIPDIPEYPVIAPVAKPGLGDRFNLDGWKVERSYFGYRPNPYNTSFGIPDYSAQGDAPELFFTIQLARDFLNPFVSRMLPVVVVSVLVFALLLAVSRTRLRPEDFPVSTGIVTLSFLSALTFVLILGHNSLRSSLNGSSQIIYLEYFYFIMYVAIMLVAARVISFLFGVRVGWTEYRQTVTVERLYWPFVMLATFVATWWVFY